MGHGGGERMLCEGGPKDRRTKWCKGGRSRRVSLLHTPRGLEKAVNDKS